MIAVLKDRKSISFLKLEPFIPTSSTNDSFIWSLHSFCPACADKSGDFSPFHFIVCSSTSHLFTSRLRLFYWSTLKIANELPIFAPYYAFVVSLTWLAYVLSHDCFSYINSLGFFYLFSVSLWRRTNARNVRLYYPYRQYINLFIFRFVSLHFLRRTLSW